MKKLILVLGKSCTGKSTLINDFTGKHEDVFRCIMHTTRDIREGEVDGIDYYFDLEEDMILNNILELRSYESNGKTLYYWTNNDFLEEDGYDTAIYTATPDSLMEIYLHCKKNNIEMVPVYLYRPEDDRMEMLEKRVELLHEDASTVQDRLLADEKDYPDTLIEALKEEYNLRVISLPYHSDIDKSREMNLSVFERALGY